VSDLAATPDRLWYRYPPVGYVMRLVNDGHSLTVTFPDQYKGGLGVSSGTRAYDVAGRAAFSALQDEHPPPV